MNRPNRRLATRSRCPARMMCMRVYQRPRWTRKPPGLMARLAARLRLSLRLIAQPVADQSRWYCQEIVSEPEPALVGRCDPGHRSRGKGLYRQLCRSAGRRPEPEEKVSWFQRLKRGLSRSSKELSSSITGIFTKRKLDEDTLQELEDVLDPRGPRHGNGDPHHRYAERRALWQGCVGRGSARQ